VVLNQQAVEIGRTKNMIAYGKNCNSPNIRARVRGNVSFVTLTSILSHSRERRFLKLETDRLNRCNL
jgi:hypothetical protein